VYVHVAHPSRPLSLANSSAAPVAASQGPAVTTAVLGKAADTALISAGIAIQPPLTTTVLTAAAVCAAVASAAANLCVS
jgi:hypothetical protein